MVVRREEAGRLPEFAARCTRTTRRAVVAVRATNGPRLPILYLGREVGRTDASGAATLGLDVQPGTDVELVLDTRGVKRIHPASPTLSFKAASTDDVVLLDQKFILDRPGRGARCAEGWPADRQGALKTPLVPSRSPSLLLSFALALTVSIPSQANQKETP